MLLLEGQLFCWAGYTARGYPGCCSILLPGFFCLPMFSLFTRLQMIHLQHALKNNVETQNTMILEYTVRRRF
jgi:hypothetical protein